MGAKQSIVSHAEKSNSVEGEDPPQAGAGMSLGIGLGFPANDSNIRIFRMTSSNNEYSFIRMTNWRSFELLDDPY